LLLHACDWLQGMVLGWTWWIKFWNIFYGSAHMAVTVFVLGFLFALRPAAYQSCRTVFILMNLLAIIGYAAYPLMPPRLVNVCDDPYGGCVREYSFVDTLHEVSAHSWGTAAEKLGALAGLCSRHPAQLLLLQVP
jgi:hypothetical protein